MMHTVAPIILIANVVFFMLNESYVSGVATGKAIAVRPKIINGMESAYFSN